jgi:GrpB-like predicted nucleotidyltransferase (UPF0157 family)
LRTVTEPADPIEIVDYDPAWVERYRAEEAAIRRALKPWLRDIEHIGSTAVPGLAAKPVIDIQVAVESLSATLDLVTALRSLGYEYVPELEADLPQRRYFRRVVDGRRTDQIHVVEQADHEWWGRHVAFRDWLRGHPADRDSYADLKRSLATRFRDDRAAYTDAKTEFVQAIERAAANDTRP